MRIQVDLCGFTWIQLDLSGFAIHLFGPGNFHINPHPSTYASVALSSTLYVQSQTTRLALLETLAYSPLRGWRLRPRRALVNSVLPLRPELPIYSTNYYQYLPSRTWH